LQNKQVQKVSWAWEPGQVTPKKMSYVDTICLGCGVPGHFKKTCDKKPLCLFAKQLLNLWTNVM
jgi:hypothetical protein